MNITSVKLNQSFGKQAIMTCSIKDKKNNKYHASTLYKLNPKDLSDVKDVYYSKQTFCLEKDFMKEREKPSFNREFYLLQNDKTKEVIACAQTTHRFRRDNLSRYGQYTLIEVANENPKYLNGAEPLFAYIAKQAIDKYDKFVYTAFDEEIIHELKKSKFSKTKTGEYFIPEKRFLTVINQAEQRYRIKELI